MTPSVTGGGASLKAVPVDSATVERIDALLKGGLRPAAIRRQLIEEGLRPSDFTINRRARQLGLSFRGKRDGPTPKPRHLQHDLVMVPSKNVLEGHLSHVVAEMKKQRIKRLIVSDNGGVTIERLEQFTLEVR